MPRYDRNYDYGLRGYPQATAFRGQPTFRQRGSAYDYDLSANADRHPLPNRVTARYNMDYVVGNRGDRYPRNFNAFTGDREDRVGDLRYSRAPYTTIGGTRTYRGGSYPSGYDYGYDRYDRDFRGY
jgi:hypothetical protein